LVVLGGSVVVVDDEGGSDADKAEDAALALDATDDVGGSLEVTLLPFWEGSLTMMEEERPLSSP
jgi:hypothetical protein